MYCVGWIPKVTQNACIYKLWSSGKSGVNSTLPSKERLQSTKSLEWLRNKVEQKDCKGIHIDKRKYKLSSGSRSLDAPKIYKRILIQQKKRQTQVLDCRCTEGLRSHEEEVNVAFLPSPSFPNVSFTNQIEIDIEDNNLGVGGRGVKKMSREFSNVMVMILQVPKFENSPAIPCPPCQHYQSD